ncbi:MAG: S4 domain-containing protein, partial [Oscillospiraceae bacterium]|nr:S4 domain-containing protein [Oscillospiraceae bacterium]
NHGHFKVNGIKTDIPSYLCKIGDVISIKKKSLDNNVFEAILENSGRRPVPQWLDVDREAHEVKIIAMPERDQIETPVEEHLIVEFYSK